MRERKWGRQSSYRLQTATEWVDLRSSEILRMVERCGPFEEVSINLVSVMCKTKLHIIKEFIILTFWEFMERAAKQITCDHKSE